VDAHVLLYGAPPMIFLCGVLQPLGGEAAMLLGGAAAPCAKGLLNPCDDAQHSVVRRVAGHAIGLDRPLRLHRIIFIVE
jgi:hypothetical protein